MASRADAIGTDGGPVLTRSEARAVAAVSNNRPRARYMPVTDEDAALAVAALKRTIEQSENEKAVVTSALGIGRFVADNNAEADREDKRTRLNNGDATESVVWRLSFNGNPPPTAGALPQTTNGYLGSPADRGG